MCRRKKPRERVRESERDEIWIQATFLGTMSFPSPRLCFPGTIRHKAYIRFLHEIFIRSWPVSRNMSVASSPPCWHPCLHKGHDVWVKLNDTIYFSKAANTLPIEMAAHRVFFLRRSITSFTR